MPDRPTAPLGSPAPPAFPPGPAPAQRPAAPSREDALRGRIAELRAQADAIPQLIWSAGPGGAIESCNRRWVECCGLSVEQIPGSDWTVPVHPDDAPLVKERWKAAVKTGEPFEAECRIRRPGDGAYHWHLGRAMPIRDEQGRVARWCATFTDVQALKGSSDEIAEMRHLEHFLESAVENIPDMIFVKDAKELRFVRVNKKAEELLGWPRETLIGKSDYEMSPKEDADFFTAKDRAVLESGKLLDIPEEPVHTAKGLRILHTKKIPILDEKGRPQYLLGISRDITARKRAEELLVEKNRLLEEAIRSERQAHDALKQAQGQLVQSEKLAALGQLVAGVAHEINNPLVFVTNNVVVLQRDFAGLLEVLKLYQSADAVIASAATDTHAQIGELAEAMDLPYTVESLGETLVRSRDGLKRIQQIVRDLREFSRQEAVGDLQQGADLNSGIQSTINIVRGRARAQRVELVLELTPLPGVTCYPPKINQVIMNLVANAIDACGEGGKVTIRSKAMPDGVEIQVADTGSGIEPAVRDKIFDPFFTTKPQGKGTGLGLSISHGIVADHGGRITVESTIGQGTCFTVYLPLIPPAAALLGQTGS